MSQGNKNSSNEGKPHGLNLERYQNWIEKNYQQKANLAGEGRNRKNKDKKSY